jgi:hypothetical protein
MFGSKKLDFSEYALADEPVAVAQDIENGNRL